MLQINRDQQFRVCGKYSIPLGEKQKLNKNVKAFHRSGCNDVGVRKLELGFYFFTISLSFVNSRSLISLY